MEKVNLIIEDYEDKKASTGKRYTRFKTDQGWMSVFEKDIIDALKDCEGKTVSVDMAVTDKTVDGNTTTFKNIRKFHKVVDDAQVKEETVSIPKGIVSNKFEPTSMYTSYAKDVFIGIKQAGDGSDDLIEDMNVAIELVKQAKKAFE